MGHEAVSDLSHGIYRRIYSGFITGQRIARLSPSAEMWFWRVMVTVDDFGNGRADPELCRAATAGTRKVTVKQVAGWLREMRDAGLIEFYTVKGELLLHVVEFEKNQPANRNGKRIKRFPGVGESRGIQVNPDASSSPDSGSGSGSDTDTDTEKPRSRAAVMRTVFDFWKTEMNHPRAKLDDERQKLITARLKDGYSEDDLVTAIRGCKNTPFNMGQNEQQRVYDDIELICRDAKHVDQFIARATNGQRTKTVQETLEERLADEARAAAAAQS